MSPVTFGLSLFSVFYMTGEHRGFIVEMFIKNNESITATLRAFPVHKLDIYDPVPNRNSTVKEFGICGPYIFKEMLHSVCEP